MINGIGSILSSIATQAGAANGNTAAAPASKFADVFQSAIGDVDTLQNSADQQVAKLIQGAPSADVGKTMVSVEKADIAFQLMLQVRNKVVSAYQEMEKMQF